LQKACKPKQCLHAFSVMGDGRNVGHDGFSTLTGFQTLSGFNKAFFDILVYTIFSYQWTVFSYQKKNYGLTTDN